MTRIFEDANHKNYGPIRRMWVILAGLGMIDFANEQLWQIDETEDGYTWDYCMSLDIDNGSTEVIAKNKLLQILYSRQFMDSQFDSQMVEIKLDDILNGNAENLVDALKEAGLDIAKLTDETALQPSETKH